MATTLLQRARPNMGGSITRGGVTTNYAPSPGQNMDPDRAGSGGTITKGGVTRAYAPTPGRSAPSTGVSPAAQQFLQDGVDPGAELAPAAPNYNTYAAQPQRQSYNTFLARNPTSPAATGSLSRPAYNPPQQTERANPLSGDNNIPLEGASTGIARPPFVQRGSGVPRGQDSMAPVKMTQTMDADIGTSMQGTQDRLRGTTPLYRPQFQQQQQPQRQKSYEDYRRSIFG